MRDLYAVFSLDIYYKNEKLNTHVFLPMDESYPRRPKYSDASINLYFKSSQDKPSPLIEKMRKNEFLTDYSRSLNDSIPDRSSLSIFGLDLALVVCRCLY